jgi:hypothetical protein
MTDMPRGPSVNRLTLGFLGNMRGNPLIPQGVDKPRDIVPVIPPEMG